MGSLDEEPAMLRIYDAVGTDKTVLVSIQDPETGSGLAEPLVMKARYPDRFFVFAGLDHAAQLSGGQVRTPTVAEQVAEFAEVGCDGIKMIEGKPTSRQKMDIPVTDAYFAEYWAAVEELQLPILWHVNDPEEFWDPDKIPGWAKQRDWGYGPDDVTKEELYDEVQQILQRYPQLKVIFAHFYFLSADLPRAARFLDRHPNVFFDLAPGIEMLYNISRDPDAGREFFTRYASRILFGTDIFSRLTVDQARARAGVIHRWLETEDEFRVPEEADFLLGPPEDGVIRGMNLSDAVLEDVYRTNIIRTVGPTPKSLNKPATRDLLGRLAVVAETMSGTSAASTPAGRGAELLQREV